MTYRAIRTLVIGGCGFIGSPLVRQLVDMGRIVTVLGRRGLEDVAIPEGVNYIQGDFAKLEIISDLLNEHDEVINLAYASKPNTSFYDPVADLQDNLLATVQLFKEVASRGLLLIVISSGGTVYGQADNYPLNENHPTRPISPYGLTKLTIEHYAYFYAVTKGLRFVCLRIANAYGVGQEPLSGQGFISTAIALSAQDKSLTIFGDGTAIRDYVYVDDVAKAICSALTKGRYSHTYNIGNGIGRSINEVIASLLPIMSDLGKKLTWENVSPRLSDVHANVLNCSKAFNELDWSASTDFSVGLVLTRDWVLEKINAK